MIKLVRLLLFLLLYNLYTRLSIAVASFYVTLFKGRQMSFVKEFLLQINIVQTGREECRDSGRLLYWHMIPQF